MLKLIASKPDARIYEVFVHDKYYDNMTGNDDLEDLPTIVRVLYNDRGEILNVAMADSTSDLCDEESPVEDLQHFYRTCGINPSGGLKDYKKFSIYE